MNLLITGAWSDALSHLDEIRALGHDVAFLQQEKDALPCEADWVEGVVCNGLFLHHPIEQFTNLRYIQLTSGGFDRVPMDYVNANHIEIHNARGVYSIPMAEFAVASVLSIYKRLDFFRENQKAHKWEKARNLKELYGSTVLIVGCGSVGTECAKRFKAFGCRTVGVDIAPRSDPNYDRMLPLSELDSTIEKADVIILTLPLTDETKGLISEQRLNHIKGILVNISRGAVIDQSALEKWDGVAVLDVFEEEPLEPSSPLWKKDLFLITPHNSFVGNGNEGRLMDVILSTLERENA